jgi:Uma2 family endonuclease
MAVQDAQELIPEVWLIDVDHETITQYAHPLADGYRHQVTLARGQTLVAQTIADLEISIDVIFG